MLLLEDDVIASAPASPRLAIPDDEAAAIVSELSLQVASAFFDCLIPPLCAVYLTVCTRLRVRYRNLYMHCLWGNRQVHLHFARMTE